MEAPNFPVNTWDDDIVHIMEHNNWRKRQEYESSKPEIKQLFESHVLTHEMRLLTNYGIPVSPDMPPEIIHSLAFRIVNQIPMMPSEGGQEQAPVGSSPGGQ
jgi:hypothetical protein